MPEWAGEREGDAAVEVEERAGDEVGRGQEGETAADEG